MNKNPTNEETTTIRHPSNLRKKDLSDMLEYKRSDYMQEFMEKEILPHLGYPIKNYKKKVVFTKRQTKDILTVLFQKEFLIQEQIDMIVKDKNLTQFGRTTISKKISQ